MRRIFVFVLCFLCVSAKDFRSTSQVATIDISGVDLNELNELKQSPSFNWWAQFGDILLVGGSEGGLSSASVRYLKKWNDISASDLQLVLAGHKNELPSNVKFIVNTGHIAVVAGVPLIEGHGDEHFDVRKFKINEIYVQSGAHYENPAAWSPEQIAAARSIMNEVDGVRWYNDVGTLTNWNRHISSVDVVSARDWFKDQFSLLNPSNNEIQKFQVGSRDAWNVIATFESGSNSEIYIVSGHYDSISEQPFRTAPGAEDNASGSAGVLELARIFANKQSNATLIFIAFSGEEEGLIGSKAYVRNLPPEVRSRIRAVINMDMIGYSRDDSEDVLLETHNDFRFLSDHIAVASGLVEGLRYFTSFNPFGSDHMPFIDAGVPAILTIDNDWDGYSSYHRTSDTIDKISRDMGLAILKMNAAALSVLAGTSAE